MTLPYSFRGVSFSGVGYKQLVRLAVDHCFVRSQADLNMPCRAMEAGGVNRCQRASLSKEFDGKELQGAACDMELRGPLFPIDRRLGSQPIFRHLQVWY